jgi:predicted DsbA family dithiol-disulfide isomerase
MGGLLADWSRYHDPINEVTRPAHMGPRWYEVGETTGMPIDARLWHDDPPASSYPACLAVKAAERQGAAAGEWYLRRVREAAMLRRRNVARRDVLLDVAASLAGGPGAPVAFDAARFAADVGAPATLDALRADLREARDREIGRFPTLVLEPAAEEPGTRGVLLVGYRPYEALRAAAEQVGGQFDRDAGPHAADAYARAWPGLTARELEEACGGAAARAHGRATLPQGAAAMG